MNETLKVIKSRRSIRQLRKTIAEEDLQAILEAALFAPSAVMPSPGIYGYQNKTIIDELAQLLKPSLPQW